MFKNTLSPEVLFGILFFSVVGCFVGILGDTIEQHQRYGSSYYRDDFFIETGVYIFVAVLALIGGLGILWKKKWIAISLQIIFILIALVAGAGIITNLRFFLREPLAFACLLSLYIGVSSLFVFGLGNTNLFPWLGVSPKNLHDEILDFDLSKEPEND